jgi:hypothetical protein
MCVSRSSHKLCVIHLTNFPLHPFLDSFLHFTVLIFSSTALIILDNFISSGFLLKTYPPFGPLALKTKLFFFNLRKQLF